MGDSSNTQKLATTFNNVNKEAQAFYATIAQAEKLTEQQTTKTNAFVVALQSNADVARNLQEEYAALAKRFELIGDNQQAEVYRSLSAEMKKQADAAANLATKFTEKSKITAQDIVSIGQATQATKERADAEKQLAQILAAAPVRNLDAQLAVTQQLVGLGRALADLEQSRFGIIQARGQYELSEAERRGASEAQLRALRQKNDQIEAQALAARFAALVQQQAIEQALLQLSQEKARTEANLAIYNARIELLKQENLLRAAQAKGDLAAIATEQAKYNLAAQVLGVEQSKLSLLQRTQPLEQLIAEATNQTAVNALQAQAASKGWEISQGAVYKNTEAVNKSVAQMAIVTKTAADGSVVITQEFTKTAGQANAVSKQIAAAASGSDLLSKAAAKAAFGFDKASDSTKTLQSSVKDVSTETQRANSSAQNLAKSADKTSSGFNKTTTAATKTKDAAADAAGATSDIGGNAASSNKNFGGLQKTVADTAKAAAYGAQMANVFSRASQSIGGIAKAMASAANSAVAFYSTLAKASGLPNGRWTGGPVDAGTTYRINELGQEAFLRSSGRVSLINKPANSLWTAPSSGVVIPAGITEQLKSRGVFKPGTTARANSGGSVLDTRDMASNLARQAVAIGKLQESVDQLVAKDWNVQVRVRNTASGATYLDTLSRMR